MTEQLTLAEAASISGISVNTFRVALMQGRLHGSKRKDDSSRGGRLIWVVERSELDRFAARHRQCNKTPWTDVDTEIIIELLKDGCTDAQIAAHVVRSPTATSQYIAKLRKRGLLDRQSRSMNMGPSRVPFCVPKSAILVAKSCAKCGKLRDAAYFRQYTSGRIEGHYDSGCQICNLSDGKRRYRKLKEREPDANTNTGGLHQLLQQVTLENATRSNQPYTDAEMEQVLDPSKSTLEVALNLGRTFYAIRVQRSLNDVEQNYSDIFFHKKKRKRLSDSHWTIHFPAAAKALREHFRQLGEAVPEELWEWNDDEESVA